MSERDDIKGTWCVSDAEQRVHRVTMCAPHSRNCNSQCPWLVANHGTTKALYYDHEVPGIPSETEFSFAPWKRARIWDTDLKDGAYGYGSLCHVRLPGTQLNSGNVWEVVARQCTGTVVMQQRELLRHVVRGESALTSRGAARVAGDMLGREVAEDEVGHLDIGELIALAHPYLFDPSIGSDAVAPPLSEEEIHEWERLRVPPDTPR